MGTESVSLLRMVDNSLRQRRRLKKKVIKHHNGDEYELVISDSDFYSSPNSTDTSLNKTTFDAEGLDVNILGRPVDNTEKEPRNAEYDTPWTYLLQLFAVVWHISSFVLFTIFGLICMAVPLSWFIWIPILIYHLAIRPPTNGLVVHRHSQWFRSLSIWKYYCDYFPITLVKTYDLPPTFVPNDEEASHANDQADEGSPILKKTDKIIHYLKAILCLPRNRNASYGNLKPAGPRYIFGYHPHGIGALGAFGAFGTEGCGFSELFPGIPMSLMTLVTQFHIPLYRDYLLALGITGVSRKNALSTLKRNQSICIVVGGARESLLRSIDNTEIILDKRRGFIKLALNTGNVGIVPVFAFGETNCYNIIEIPKGSWWHKVQFLVKEKFGFTVPVFYARGLFNYEFGLVPFRAPVNVVVGKPIYVNKRYENPDSKIIDYYHDLYLKELQRLYYDNRHLYGYGNKDLKIVG